MLRTVLSITLAMALFAVPAGQSAYASEAESEQVYNRDPGASEARTGGGIFKGLFKGARAKKAKAATKPNPVPVSFSRSWIDSQPRASGGEQWRCLSEALYFEARGETVKGQFAVAEVIMNRVKSSRFPSTLCGVINQGTGRKYQCQFTYTCDGRKEVIAEPQAFKRVAKVARAVIDGTGVDLTSGATHYHTSKVRPKWSRVYKETARIGVHIFYRHNYRTASAD